MHPRIDEVMTFLAREREELDHAVQSVPQSLRETRSHADRWSVAEIVEHLAIVESRVARVLSDAISEAIGQGLPDETEVGSPVADFGVHRVYDRSTPRIAGEPSRPNGSLSAADAWAQLTASRAKLTAALGAGDGRALGTIMRPHPVFGPMNVYQWAVFVGAHEGRHAAQVRELRDALTQSGLSAPPA